MMHSGRRQTSLPSGGNSHNELRSRRRSWSDGKLLKVKRRGTGSIRRGRNRIGLFRWLVLTVRSLFFVTFFFAIISRSVELPLKPAPAPFIWPCYAESCLIVDSDDDEDGGDAMDLS